MREIEITELEKQANDKLVAAHILLKEASELAYQGGFSLSFLDSNYYPSSVFDATDESKAKTWGLMERDMVWENLSDEDRCRIHDAVQKYEDSHDMYMREYADTDEWWSPSTC